jgi:hypothetical protein
MNKLSTFIKAWGQQSLGSMLRRVGTKIRNWWKAPEPHPWSIEIEEAVQQPDAVRICHHCLTPQEHLGWFCPECGAATGPYNNCMPFINIFSTGEVLRAGVNPKIRLASWVSPVYWIVGLFEYGIFTPLYWFRLLQAQKKRKKTPDQQDHDSQL